MCISPRCFKRELSRSRGAPPPPRPRNSSPAPISPNRSPCFISLFRFYPPEEIIIRPPPSLNPSRRLPFRFLPFYEFERYIPRKNRSFEKKDRLLLSPPPSFSSSSPHRFLSDRASLRRGRAQVFAESGFREKGIGKVKDFYGHGFGRMEKKSDKTRRSGSNAG